MAIGQSTKAPGQTNKITVTLVSATKLAMKEHDDVRLEPLSNDREWQNQFKANQIKVAGKLLLPRLLAVISLFPLFLLLCQVFLS